MIVPCPVARAVHAAADATFARAARNVLCLEVEVDMGVRKGGGILGKKLLEGSVVDMSCGYGCRWRRRWPRQLRRALWLLPSTLQLAPVQAAHSDSITQTVRGREL